MRYEKTRPIFKDYRVLGCAKLELPIIFLLVVVSCVKEENLESENNFDQVQNQLSQTFQNSFNPEQFRQTLRYQYQVDWSNPIKQYSEQLDSYFYEFPITYSNAFNPDVFNQQVKRRFCEKYKIVVTEKEEGEFEFFIAKYFLNAQKSPNVENEYLSINASIGFEATIHLYDKDAEMVFAKHISNEKELKDFYLKSNFDRGGKTSKWVDVCKTITIYYYRDWYRVVYDAYGNIISSTYLYTTFEGTSQKEECHQEWTPDPDCVYGFIENLCYNYPAEYEPTIFCPEGYRDNGFGSCEKIPRIEEEDILKEGLENSIASLVLINGLGGESQLTLKQINWINDHNNAILVAKLSSAFQSSNSNAITSALSALMDNPNIPWLLTKVSEQI